MYTHRVQYYETDMMGIAHHANYLHWMEEARIAFMDEIGYSYRRMESEGVVSPVRAVSIQYKKPCTFGDLVDIDVTVAAFNGVVMTIEYDMRKDGETICAAKSEHVFLTREGRIVRMKRDMPEFCAIIDARIPKEP